MIGIEQAGIAETMDFVFKKFDTATQNKLAQVFQPFLTNLWAIFNCILGGNHQLDVIFKNINVLGKYEILVSDYFNSFYLIKVL